MRERYIQLSDWTSSDRRTTVLQSEEDESRSETQPCCSSHFLLGPDKSSHYYTAYSHVCHHTGWWGSPLLSPSTTDTLVSLADILCCTHFWLCYFSSLLQFTHSFFLVCYLNSLNFQRISALFIMPLFPVGSTWQDGGLFFFLACFWDSCCLPELFIAVDVFRPAFAVCYVTEYLNGSKKKQTTTKFQGRLRLSISWRH